MQTHQHKIFRLPHELDRVPSDIGGIYGFFLRFPTDYELGLVSGKIDSDRVAELMSSFILRVTPLIKSPTSLRGSIFSGQPALHLRTTFALAVTRSDTDSALHEFQGYLSVTGQSLEGLRSAAALLRLVFASASPSYLGMTAKQSLSARLLQHFQRRTTFGKSLEKLAIPWSYFDFRCVPVAHITPEVARSLERVAQALFQPHLSLS